jgi:hypothetical protein
VGDSVAHGKFSRPRTYMRVISRHDDPTPGEPQGRPRTGMVRCGIVSTRLFRGFALSNCSWPLGQLILENDSVVVGPSLASFAISGVIALALLLAVPPVGLLALLVVMVAYLAVPRWRSTMSELRVKQDIVLGLGRGFLLYNSTGVAPIRVWLPRQSRLAAMLVERGIHVEQVGDVIRGRSKGLHITGSLPASLLSALTGCLLLVSVGVRLFQDIPLFREAGTDPLAASLVATEIVPLTIGALLGLSAVLMAWLSWTGRVQSRIPSAIVFGAILLVGLFLAIRSYSQAVGWMLVVLSVATLAALLRFRGEGGLKSG